MVKPLFALLAAAVNWEIGAPEQLVFRRAVAAPPSN